MNNNRAGGQVLAGGPHATASALQFTCFAPIPTPCARMLFLIGVWAQVVEITKIIIIKKYKCESDSWSCKGNDYCDVSLPARLPPARPHAGTHFRGGVCCLTRPGACCGNGLLHGCGPRLTTSSPRASVGAGRQGVGLPRGHRLRLQLGRLWW